MEWARRVRPPEIRRLYRLFGMGLYDEAALLEVGWGLYARCRDVVAVTRAFNQGELPCPECGASVQRQRALPRGSGGGRSRYGGWFHCPSCESRLLWQDCRDALRKCPRCFDCHGRLTRTRGSGRLKCRCGKAWEGREYRQSMGRRVRLPCPHCGTTGPRRVATIGRGGQMTRTLTRPLSCRTEERVVA